MKLGINENHSHNGERVKLGAECDCNHMKSFTDKSNVFFLLK